VKGTAIIKLTTTMQVSVDGVVQGNARERPRRRDESADRSGGVGQGARLFPATGPDIALDLVESRAFPKGITIQVYRPAGRPQYATD
jgi:hypothetical protein